MEEYVPIKTPQIIADTKPLTTSPPNTNKATNANKVVIDVIRVLDNVWLIDKFKSSCNFLSDLIRFSLILSKTTTVSFIEYPAMVRIAAIDARLNSIWLKEKNPIVEITSWNSAIKAPKPNCQPENLNQI